jgi:hypothetical protein
VSEYLMVGDRARWSVMWVAKKKGKLYIIEKTFENDFAAATELYLKVKRAGKPMATLRCMNVGFPPPERLRPHYETRAEVVVRRNNQGRRKKYKRRIEVEVIPLSELNLKGVWWCPYCRELRRFEHWDGVATDGSFFQTIKTSKPGFFMNPGMYCPMCGINQNDSHVRRWNPQAALLEFRINNKRRRSGRKTTRQRTKRR